MTASFSDNVRYPRTKLEIRWDGANWADESAYLISHSGEMRIAAPGDDLVGPGDIARASVILWNDGRFSWRRTDGALYAHIGGAAGLFGIRARLSVGFASSPSGTPGSWNRIFTGVIYSWSEDTSARRVTLEMRDLGYLYVQERASTAVYEDQRVDQWISALATLVGITDISIDASPYTIPYSWLDAESVLSEMWLVAQADGSRLYFDVGGTLRFEQAAHWAHGPHGTVAWTLDADDYQLPEPTVTVDELVTAVTVEVQPRAKGASDTVYTLDTPRVCPPGGTIEFDCRLSQAALSISDPVANTDYEIRSSGGVDLSGACSLSLAKYGQRVVVTMVNGHANLQAHLTHLDLTGTPLIGGPTLEIRRDVDSPAISFERIRGVSGNPYMQREDVAEALASMLRDRGAQLNPVYTLRGAPGIPALALGDRVQFEDSHGMTGTREGFVIGVHWTFDQGYSQDIALVDASELFPHPNYFIIGTTALGGYGRCWY
jgi:hypothetical protein